VPSTADYCREIERYLCQKNDGHLVRVVGPSFDLVSRWAATGVPLAIAYQGIDRYFERYYRKGPRRRPVRIDFCEADVLEVFDEWRRALGLTASAVAGADSTLPEASTEAGRTGRPGRGTSVPAHLERALLRLTNARATGRLGAQADDAIDRLSRELEVARASKGGVRGDARRVLGERLAAIDVEVIAVAWHAMSDDERHAIEDEAAAVLRPFRDTMPADRYQRALAAATRRLVRDRAGLPTIEML
jgi:hypothetical protein